MDWVEQYLVKTHGKKKAEKIMADIDRRWVASIPACLRFESADVLLLLELQQLRLLRDSVDFRKEEGSNSGRGMIQRH